ncbi:hypothetical protein [Hyphomonas sp.]|uniref:hypothetical protein n=1 Tax=Hyphomonas sp. TaxID=87 RepID=UPI0039195FDA
MKQFVRTTTLSALLGLLFAAAPAFATPFNCDSNRIVKTAREFQLSLQSSVTDDAFAGHLAEISMDAQRCPDLGWVRIIAAGAELRAAKRMEVAEGSKAGITTAAFSHVERAADHILAAQRDIPETLQYGGFHLRYDDWYSIVKDGVDALTRYAEAGQVNPLVSDSPPPITCNTVTAAMATGAATYQTISRPSSLKLLDTVAGACRSSPDPLDWSVLAQRAKAIMRQIEGGKITGQSETRTRLGDALDDVAQYLAGRSPHFALWSASDQDKLDKLVAEHGSRARIFSADGVAEVPREEWFTAGNVGTDDVIYSIALEFSRNWSPLAAGINNPPVEEKAPALSAFMTLVRTITSEADKAGQGIAGRETIHEALAQFQDGSVRTPETADLPGAPKWMYDSLRNTLTSRIAELQGKSP